MTTARDPLKESTEHRSFHGDMLQVSHASTMETTLSSIWGKNSVNTGKRYSTRLCSITEGFITLQTPECDVFPWCFSVWKRGHNANTMHSRALWRDLLFYGQLWETKPCPDRTESYGKTFIIFWPPTHLFIQTLSFIQYMALFCLVHLQRFLSIIWINRSWENKTAVVLTALK